ncbi:MAG: fasciclin domain-containing protein [Bacteriovorax sp.]|nr:fasciclin domain-containing protein [Rhizobacter sp.]
MQRRPWLALASLSAALLFGGCATMNAPMTVAQTIAANPQLSTAARLIQEAGLNETLQGTGPFTVFVPSDEAFKAVPAAMVEALGKDKTRLKAVLSYHVVAGNLASVDVKNGPIKTVQGSDLSLYRSGTFVTADEAVVTTADVRATNGMVHIVDKVLMPPR